jgi:hypothetical protein
MDVDECIGAYKGLAKTVFEPKKVRKYLGKLVSGIMGSSFDEKKLEAAIKEVLQKKGLKADASLTHTGKSGCKV